MPNPSPGFCPTSSTTRAWLSSPTGWKIIQKGTWEGFKGYFKKKNLLLMCQRKILCLCVSSPHQGVRSWVVWALARSTPGPTLSLGVKADSVCYESPDPSAEPECTLESVRHTNFIPQTQTDSISKCWQVWILKYQSLTYISKGFLVVLLLEISKRVFKREVREHLEQFEKVKFDKWKHKKHPVNTDAVTGQVLNITYWPQVLWLLHWCFSSAPPIQRFLSSQPGAPATHTPRE